MNSTSTVFDLVEKLAGAYLPTVWRRLAACTRQPAYTFTLMDTGYSLRFDAECLTALLLDSMLHIHAAGTIHPSIPEWLH